LVEEHFEAQLDLVEQLLLPLTAPGADLAAEHSVLAAEQPDFSPTAPGAAVFAAEHSDFAEQSAFFSPTAPGAAAVEHLDEQSAFAVAQQPDFFSPTAPGAVVFWVLAQAPRKAKAVRAARVAIVFIEESPSVCRDARVGSSFGRCLARRGFVLPRHAGQFVAADLP
jgi:hypothetical protein